MSPRSRLAPILALLGLALGLLAPASASAEFYFSRNAWQQVTLFRVDRDFNHLPDHTQFLLGSPYVDQGVTFSATNNYLYSWGPGCCGGHDLFGTGGSWLIGPWNNGSLVMTLPPNTNSVGFDLAAYNGYPPGFDIVIQLADGTVWKAYTPIQKSHYVFVGVANYPAPIVSVTITSENWNSVVLDNVATGIFMGPFAPPELTGRNSLTAR